MDGSVLMYSSRSMACLMATARRKSNGHAPSKADECSSRSCRGALNEN
jgi:hypothetical protein